MPNTIEQIIAYETGELDYEGTLNLFSKLIKSGQAWSLQGRRERGQVGNVFSDLYHWSKW